MKTRHKRRSDPQRSLLREPEKILKTKTIAFKTPCQVSYSEISRPRNNHNFESVGKILFRKYPQFFGERRLRNETHK